jgi:hypothetical protein
VLVDLDCCAEGEALHRDVCARRERLLGSEHPDTISSRIHLANALRIGKRLPEAEQMYRDLLADAERLHGTGHDNTATARINLASVLYSMGRLDEAESQHNA